MTFYATIAQVIPTLLIALAVEFVGMRGAQTRAGLIPTEEELQERFASGNPPVDGLIILTFLLGLMVFLAEVSAVMVLLTGTDTWFVFVAGPFCALATLVMTLFVPWVYWVRLIHNAV